MALPPAEQGREGLCREGREALPGSAGIAPGLPAPPGSASIPISFPPQDQLSYEERACEGGRFAAVELVGKPFDEASKEGAVKLLKYVGGSNDKGERCLADVCG